jgi:hypothetical protein
MEVAFRSGGEPSHALSNGEKPSWPPAHSDTIPKAPVLWERLGVSA